jgi:hypothetical protein
MGGKCYSGSKINWMCSGFMLLLKESSLDSWEEGDEPWGFVKRGRFSE